MSWSAPSSPSAPLSALNPRLDALLPTGNRSERALATEKSVLILLVYNPPYARYAGHSRGSGTFCVSRGRLMSAIRPLGGALIAVATLGEASPTVEGLVALIGGAVAASTHVTKAGTRAIANASPEPFSNWLLSLAEDAFVLGLGWVTLNYPIAAFVVCVVLLTLIAIFFVVLVRAARRRWGMKPPPQDLTLHGST